MTDDPSYYTMWLKAQRVPAQQCVVCRITFTPRVRVWLRHKHRPFARWCCSRSCAGRLGGASLWHQDGAC